MRCPACQALNPESAEWCTQCYASLRAPEPEPEPTPAPPTTSTPGAPVAPAAGRVGASGGAGTDDAAAPSTDSSVVGYVSADGRFRRTEEGLDWRCTVCEGWNPIERTTCATCRTPFAADVDRGPEPGELTSETTALLTSALLPGLGHILMRRTGVGVARAILYVTWLVGGLLLVASAARAAQPVLPAVPLLLGALVLWALTLFDALAVHRGSQSELLRPRVLLWLTVIVMGATMLSFATAAFTVSS